LSIELPNFVPGAALDRAMGGATGRRV